MYRRLLYIFILITLFSKTFSQSVLERYEGINDPSIHNILSEIKTYPELDSGRLVLIYKLAKVFWIQGDYYEVEWLADQILLDSKKMDSPYWKGVYHNIVGNIKTRQSLLNEALIHYNEAILNFMTAGVYDRVAVMKNNLSVLYVEMSNDSLALSSSLEALEFFSSSNDIHFLSQTYTNLGNVFSSLGDTIKALDSYMKALEYDTQSKDTIGISSTYTNIGTIYAESKNYGMARVFFEHALELDNMIADQNSLMISYYNLGYNYLNESNYPIALPLFRMSLQKARQLSSYSSILKNSKALSL